MAHEHSFEKFDESRLFCKTCGEFRAAPEVKMDAEWFDRLLEAIRSTPHVCPVPYVPYVYPTPPYIRPYWESPFYYSTTNQIISQPDASIQVWNTGTATGKDMWLANATLN